MSLSPGGGGLRTWLFDLDNTLHNANPHIFPHINRAMRQYIERHLGVDKAEANRLRQHYWERYGATLLGLIRHHRIDPEVFLAETHDFEDLSAMVVFDPTVRAALAKLPGRKIIFSNGPREYARRVLRLTGLEPLFDAVYGVEDTRFQPKPSPVGFYEILGREHLEARRCILVEDSLLNLITAKRLGMKTVWVSASLRNAPCVDVKLRTCRDLPKALARL